MVISNTPLTGEQAAAILDPEHLYRTPNALAPHYSRFRVAERILLTGHSHQAWPDCGFRGQAQAWEDAARWVDGKWEAAFDRADKVRAGFARLLGAPGKPDAESYALGANTHELVVRFLSALPLRRRPRLVTTAGEFHSIRRQLHRLEEEGVSVVRVPVDPVETLSERVAHQVNDGTATALVSAVLFRDARIVPHLSTVQEKCQEVGAEFLVDAYHALGVVPFDLHSLGLGNAFVTGGGYKYCQLGEGNCFLRIPAGRKLRPVVTGWFAELSQVANPPEGEYVYYGSGAEQLAGSTYDPTSHYRAAEVFDFFVTHGLTPEFLRAVSQHQVGFLAKGFDDLDLDPDLLDRDRPSLAEIGGFLAIRSPHASTLQAGLAARGVSTDVRGEVLRLGPAPYLSDDQLAAALAALDEVARTI